MLAKVGAATKTLGVVGASHRVERVVESEFGASGSAARRTGTRRTERAREGSLHPEGGRMEVLRVWRK